MRLPARSSVAGGEGGMDGAGGASVVEPGADVRGRLERSVVWAGERVGPDEVLVEAVRGAGTTLQPFRHEVPR